MVRPAKKFNQVNTRSDQRVLGADNFLNRFASFRSGSLVGAAIWHWPASQRGPIRTAFLPKGQRSGLQIYEKLPQSYCLIIIIDTQTLSEKVKKSDGVVGRHLLKARSAQS